LFLRSTNRKKDGKDHRYFSIVENQRISATKGPRKNSLSDAAELADELHAEVQELLFHPVQRQRLSRIEINGQFLYTAIESPQRRNRILARRSAQAVPLAVHSQALQLSPDELKAAILLFYGVLDEQQRRLFAGVGVSPTGARRRHPAE
jgi:hypothetical protein